jgi:hypothetical protein
MDKERPNADFSSKNCRYYAVFDTKFQFTSLPKKGKMDDIYYNLLYKGEIICPNFNALLDLGKKEKGKKVEKKRFLCGFLFR